jgi:hypothetical protein
LRPKKIAAAIPPTTRRVTTTPPHAQPVAAFADVFVLREPRR